MQELLIATGGVQAQLLPPVSKCRCTLQTGFLLFMRMSLRMSLLVSGPSNIYFLAPGTDCGLRSVLR